MENQFKPLGGQIYMGYTKCDQDLVKEMLQQCRKVFESNKCAELKLAYVESKIEDAITLLNRTGYGKGV